MTAKKGHIVWLMAMVLCIACSHREDPVPQTPEETGTPIRFSGGMQDVENVTQGVKSHQAGPSQEAVTRSGMEAMTRAIGLETMAQSFRVWGYKNMSCDDQHDDDPSNDDYGDLQTVFPGYTVNWHANTAATTATNTHNWEYILPGSSQTIKYWDWSAKAYRFYAVTGEAADDASDLAANPEKHLPNSDYEFTFQTDATSTDLTPYYSRLWFSTGELPTYEDKQFGKTVQLEFLKPYARVRFIFIYTYPREGTILSAKSFKPTDDSKKIIRKGTVTITYPLTGLGTRETFTMTPDVNKALDAFTEDADPEDYSKVYTQTDEGWYMVLPNTGQGSYTLTVQVNNRARTCTVPEQYMQWLPGYSYTYIFKILEEGGVAIDMVQSAFTPWSDMRSQHEVYNW